MSWLPILALALIAFVMSAAFFKLPRSLWTLFGASLLFGLTGYALQGVPAQPASPKSAKEEVSTTGELMVQARKEFFPQTVQAAPYLLTSDAYTRRGQYGDAAAFLNNGLAENPGHAEAWVALGNVLAEHADGQLTEAALFAYARAEQVAPGHPGPGYFVGLGFLRSGEPGRARAIWLQLLESASDDAQWREGLERRIERLDQIMTPSDAPPISGGGSTGDARPEIPGQE